MLAVFGKMQNFLLGSSEEDEEYETDEPEFIDTSSIRRDYAREPEKRDYVRDAERRDYGRDADRREYTTRDIEKREYTTRDIDRRPDIRDKRRDNITRLYPDSRYEIILSKPKSLEDATGVINNLRMSNVCVVSLEGIEKMQAQRIVDFLSGSAYALGSVIERISNDIFIIAPDGINIAGRLKNELKADSAVFPWIASR